MAEKKICPLAAAHPNQSNSDCLGNTCACHVSVVKPAFLSRTPVIVDPENYYCYEGCGLVRVVPWQLVKREAKKSDHIDDVLDAQKRGELPKI